MIAALKRAASKESSWKEDDSFQIEMEQAEKIAGFGFFEKK